MKGFCTVLFVSCFATTKRLTPVLFVWLLASCGGGSSSSNPEVTQVANPASPLVGLWAAPVCDVRADFSLNSDYSFNSDGTYSFTANLFENSNCTSVAFTATAFGNFIEGDMSTSVDGRLATNLDLIPIEQRTITPQSAAGAQGLNIDRVCGITDWQVGQTRDVIGCNVGLIEVVTVPRVYNIYHLNQDHFFSFGNELSFSADSRPQTLSNGPQLVRLIDASQEFPATVQGLWRFSDRDAFLEFRNNGVVYSYTADVEGAACYDLISFPLLSQGGNTYTDGFGDSVTLNFTASGLDFIDEARSLVFALQPETDFPSSDLVPCAALAGG